MSCVQLPARSPGVYQWCQMHCKMIPVGGREALEGLCHGVQHTLMAWCRQPQSSLLTGDTLHWRASCHLQPAPCYHYLSFFGLCSGYRSWKMISPQPLQELLFSKTLTQQAFKWWHHSSYVALSEVWQLVTGFYEHNCMVPLMMLCKTFQNATYIHHSKLTLILHYMVKCWANKPPLLHTHNADILSWL